uniref:Uncharacterized protein n=1 Tax=Arundo donax TaxID=35708 RepID=A0A0A9EH84_ARUDO
MLPNCTIRRLRT